MIPSKLLSGVIASSSSISVSSPKSATISSMDVSRSKMGGKRASSSGMRRRCFLLARAFAQANSKERLAFESEGKEENLAFSALGDDGGPWGEEGMKSHRFCLGRGEGGGRPLFCRFGV